MKFTLEIQMDNAAFDDRHAELADILSVLAENINRETYLLNIGTSSIVRDSNGNGTGEWRVVA